MNPLDGIKLQLAPLQEKLNNLDDNSIKDVDLKEILLSNAVMFYFLQGGKDPIKIMEEIHSEVNEWAKEFLRQSTAEEIAADQKR